MEIGSEKMHDSEVFSMENDEILHWKTKKRFSYLHFLEKSNFYCEKLNIFRIYFVQRY